MTRTKFFANLFGGAAVASGTTVHNSPVVGISIFKREWEHMNYFYSHTESDEYHDARVAEFGLAGWEMVAVQYNRAFFKRIKEQKHGDNKD